MEMSPLFLAVLLIRLILSVTLVKEWQLSVKVYLPADIFNDVIVTVS